LLILTITTGAFAQQIRTKVANPANPTKDTRPNNDTVPAVYVTNGQFERIVVVRLKHQTDLLAGLDSVVKEQKIQNAVILTGIGSVRNYNYHVVNNRTFPTQNIFVKDPTAPADLLNINGYIVNGRIHAHVALSNADNAFGGHLELGTNVFTFAIITIGIFKDGIDLTRIDDSTYR
jgi:predicted DNA-binding protein with PD1-like motif